ncbi:hypothetical protein BC835DRAFT_1423971 [Cytidiella melzeri]|nr:hypothetical protein BC835DRAFT_1423971 [Cytidiella melzeri]
MRSDAQEAALGLLGLTGSIDFNKTTTPATSTSTSTSTIPLKRKTFTSASASAALSKAPSHSQPRSLAILLNKDEIDHSEPAVATSSDTIDCVCGFTYDDGFSVACDNCGTWVHALCFEIAHGNVPEIFKCWKCDPRDGVDKLREKAVRLQRAQRRNLDVEVGAAEMELERNGHGGGRKRVSSPGIERKRRVSAAAMEGGQTKRRRRLSMGASMQHPSQSLPHHPQHLHQQPASTGVGEEEHVEIDEPATHSYVPTDKDFIPHQHTRDRLKLLAQHWRGVTALDCNELRMSTPTSTALTATPVYLTPEELPRSPQTALHPLPKSSYSHPTLSSNMNVNVRPPSYIVRTTQPIPSEALIAPYTSTIIPSTVYLSDPLNSYAHLGMPKPFVHLMGPPLDVALDARLAGDSSRFVRSGCKPNAVLRPVLCQETQDSRSSETSAPLTFGVFAVRDLKAHEEVVLGWEWDDGSVIHHLPALIDMPHLFSPTRFEQYRHQMTSMLHTLSSTFTTCACGSRAKDCALNRLAEFVDGQTPPTPSPSPPSSHDGRRVDDTHASTSSHRSRPQTYLGPLIGVQRGFRTRERVPMSGGMSGVEMDARAMQPSTLLLQPEAGPSKLPRVNRVETTISGFSSATEAGKKTDRKGKGKAGDEDEDVEMDHDWSPQVRVKEDGRRAKVSAKNARQPSSVEVASSVTSTTRSSPQPDHDTDRDSLNVPERVGEARLPPKLRKKWIHLSSEVLKETARPNDSPPTSPTPPKALPVLSSRDHMDIDDQTHDAEIMPPPPLPHLVSSPSRSPPIHDFPIRTLRPADLASPTTSFANLSLLSPANGPAPHFPGCFGRFLSKPTSPSPSGCPSTVLRENTNSSHVLQSQALPIRAVEKSTMGIPFVRREASESVPADVSSSLSLKPEWSMSNAHEPEAPPQAPPPCSPQVDEAAKSANSAGTNGTDEIGKEPVMSVPHEPPEDSLKGSDSVMSVDSLPMTIPNGSESVAQIDAITEVTSETPVQPTPAAPSPVPPPKVKLSLKDFAMRKKKKREEEQAAASPVVQTVQLNAEVAASVDYVPHASMPLTHSDTPRSPSPTSEAALPVHSPVPPPVAFPDITLKTAAVEQATVPPLDTLTKPDVEAPPRETRQNGEQSHVDKSLLNGEVQDSGNQPTVTEKMDVDGPEVDGMTLEAKLELSESRLPVTGVFPVVGDKCPPQPRSPAPAPARRMDYPLLSTEYARKENHEPYHLPDRPSMGPPRTHQPLARQISQEDGEIFSPPPLKPVPLAPRSHTPPTHPRSFHHSGNTSPARGPPSAAPRRPLQPSSYRPQLQCVQNSRPLPSGPRALRGVGNGNGGPPYSNSSSSSSYSSPSRSEGPHMAPRGPSADRERDRDRADWDRFGRVGSWNRSRGGGWTR